MPTNQQKQPGGQKPKHKHDLFFKAFKAFADNASYYVAWILFLGILLSGLYVLAASFGWIPNPTPDIWSLPQQIIILSCVILGAINGYLSSKVLNDDKDNVYKDIGLVNKEQQEIREEKGCLWMSIIRIVTREVTTMGAIYFLAGVSVNLIEFALEHQSNSGQDGVQGNSFANIMLGTLGIFFDVSNPFILFIWIGIIVFMLLMIFAGLKWKSLKLNKVKEPIKIFETGREKLSTTIAKITKPIIISFVSVLLFVFLTSWVRIPFGDGTSFWPPVVYLLIIIGIGCLAGYTGGFAKCISKVQNKGAELYRKHLAEYLAKGCIGWENFIVKATEKGTIMPTSEEGTKGATSSSSGGRAIKNSVAKSGRQSFKPKILKNI